MHETFKELRQKLQEVYERSSSLEQYEEIAMQLCEAILATTFEFAHVTGQNFPADRIEIKIAPKIGMNVTQYLTEKYDL